MPSDALRWWQHRAINACPHSDLRPIYGDEIIRRTPNWNRLQCRRCGRFLDGPVALAGLREKELIESGK